MKVDGHVPRTALTRQEAAESLGISLDSFERHTQPEIRLIRRGRMRLVPVSELEAWVERNAEGVGIEPTAGQAGHEGLIPVERALGRGE